MANSYLTKIHTRKTLTENITKNLVTNLVRNYS